MANNFNPRILTAAGGNVAATPPADCRAMACERRRALLVNLGIGYLEAELHESDPHFSQGERQDPHGITFESIDAEINALHEEGHGDEAGLMVFRIRQLASGERRSRLTRHAYEQRRQEN